MINAEKYRDKISEITNNGRDFSVNKHSHEIKICCASNCPECLFDISKGFTCACGMTNWLLSEYKETIKLTRLEYAILKYLSKIHTHIARDSDDSLHAYRIAPIKERSSWEVSSEEIYLDGCADVYEDLFKFIKWEDKEPRVIKDILNNCEVIEDA